MTEFRLDREIFLPRPRVDVFAFFADARNLQELTPPFLNFQVLTPDPIEMRVGARIDYKLRLRAIPIRWQSGITVWEPPIRFVDEQRRGPYRLWVHEHRFDERDGRTMCFDHVRYAVLGGAIVNKLLVKKDLKRIFEYRREALLKRFGSPDAAR
jgi:ligand-binding SRPBCC domain-containing protein